MKKHCSYCNLFKPLEDMTFEWRGRGSRRIKKVICHSCQSDRAKRLSVQERDAFGQTVTQANRANQATQSRLIAAKKQDKQNKQKEDQIP